MGIADDIINGTYGNNKKKKKSIADSIVSGTYNSEDFFPSSKKTSTKPSSTDFKFSSILPTAQQNVSQLDDEQFKTLLANADEDEKFELMTQYKALKGEKNEEHWTKKILQVPQAFKDGYQVGDVVKTAGGTVLDLGASAVKGVVKVGENIGAGISSGVALGADLIGQDDYAERVRKNIAEGKGNILSKGITKGQEAINDYSVSGNTTDQVAESVGQIGSIWATGGLGGSGLATATMFGNSAGGTFQESYSKGANEWQAWTKAIGTGLVEAGTERLFGIFGKSGLDTGLANIVSSKISSGAGKILSRAGIQASAEALEEFLSYGGSWLLDNGLVDHIGEADFDTKWNWEEVGEQMAVAFLASGTIGAGVNVGSISNNMKANNMNFKEAVNETARQQDIKGKLEDWNGEKEAIEKELGKKKLTQTEIDELFTEMQEADTQIKSLNAELKTTPVKAQESKVENTNAQQFTDKTYYHGTRGNFDTFDNSKIGQNYDGDWSSLGKGFYFTNDSESARKFGESSINEGEVTVKEAKLDIKKPFYVDDFANNDSKTIESIKAQYELGDIANGYNLIDALKKKGLDSTEVLKQYGYDGIIAEDEVMVFDASQIKTNKQATNKRQTSDKQATIPTQQEIDNLLNIKETKSGSEYALATNELKKKYGEANVYKALNNEYSRQKGIVPQETQESIVNNDNAFSNAPTRQDIVEQQHKASMDSLMQEEAPLHSGLAEAEQQELEVYEDDIDNYNNWDEQSKKRYEYLKQQEELDTTPEAEEKAPVKDPLEDRDIAQVGNRKVKSYQAEHPEVKPYFKREAEIMLQDLAERQEGKRFPIMGADGYVDHWTGQQRVLAKDLAEFKDEYGYKYSQIEEALEKIIKGEENAISKKLEFLINDRLLKGYTAVDGTPIPADQGYTEFLRGQEWTDLNSENAKTLTDEDVEVAPEPQKQVVEQPKTEVKENIPVKEKVAQNENTDVPETKQRSWAETSTESEALKGKILLDDLDVEKINYIPITNQETLSKANKTIETKGYDKALETFEAKVKGGARVKAEDVTLGQRLMQEALKRGDKAKAIELLEDVSILLTETGQVIQSASIIQRLTPAGQLKMLEKIIDRGTSKGDKAFDGVKLTDDMKNRIMDVYNEDGQTYDQDKLNEVIDEIKLEIADQMTVKKMDKINAWRYFAMLGNPKTHIRNFVSNVANMGTIGTKNVLARTIEDTYSAIASTELGKKVGLKQIDRTKTWKKASQEIKDFANQTTLDMKDIILGEDQMGEVTSIKAKRKIFETEVLNKLTDGNSNIMQKEDWFVSKPVFKRALQEFLTVNGITTQQDIQNNPKIVEKGKKYALEQSQIAMFRQYSYLANKINEIERKNVATNMIVGSILPFKKTPINIAKTGLAYSPLGFTKTLTYDIAQVKKGNMEASTLIDHISQNTVGSALTLVGYMLAQMGFLNGGGEEDKESKYDYQLGEQSYSINIGGKSYSLSWLSPVAMPLMVGANFYEQLVEDKEWNSDVIIETLTQTLDPLSEMSFLSSLTGVLSSYETSDMGKLQGMFETMGQNYVTQFIPTALSQVAGTLDDTKRSTTSTKGEGNQFINTTINKIKYKIPILRETLEPSIDIWGNEIKQADSIGQRALDNFIAPFSTKTDITTNVDRELKSVYKETGENTVLPSSVSSNLDYKNEKYKMTNKEYTDFKKQYGQTAHEMLEELFATDTYAESDSTEKAKLISNVYEYARDVSKKSYFDKHNVEYTNTTEDNIPVYKEKPIKNAIEYDMTPEEYSYYEENPSKYKTIQTITDYETYKTISKDLYDLKGDKDSNGKTISNSRKLKVYDYINGLDLGYEQKLILAKMEYPADDRYNYEIIEYLNNDSSIDYDTMEEILLELGFKVDAYGNISW